MEILVLQDSTQSLPPPGSLPWCLAGLNPNSATLRYPHRTRLWKSDISDWNPGSATYLLCDLAQMSNLSVFVFCHEQSGSSHRYLHHRFVVRAEQVNPRY